VHIILLTIRIHSLRKFTAPTDTQMNFFNNHHSNIRSDSYLVHHHEEEVWGCQWRNNRRKMVASKEPMGLDHDRGSQITPSLRTSFSYEHIIICHLHCRHVMVRIETIIMYKGNVVLLRDHQHRKSSRVERRSSQQQLLRCNCHPQLRLV
jgi:hypothetical protein